MIIRVVQMTFRPENVPAFEALFAARKAAIRAFEGCLHLELWQGEDTPDVFFTYSHWTSIVHLENYRASSFFKETWANTKALFAAPAQAWSVAQHTTVEQ